MAVYRRTYQPYDGPLLPLGPRWLVLPRYAVRTILRSRLLVFFLLVSVMPPLVEGMIIWLLHNPAARLLLHIDDLGLTTLGASFFYRALTAQGWLAFALAAWVGPTLVAPDLTDGALALYFSRPLSRSQYVLGKASVILGFAAVVMCLPMLALFVLHGSLEGEGWMMENARIAVAILLASALWAGVLALVAVTVSAWVRWRVAATGLFLAFFFGGAGFGEIWNLILSTRWGRLFNVNYLVDLVWRALFAMPLEQALPLGVAVTALAVLGMACVLILDRRLRAKEVVR
jgi:ABC-2 type transport system permease protein